MPKLETPDGTALSEEEVERTFARAMSAPELTNLLRPHLPVRTTGHKGLRRRESRPRARPMTNHGLGRLRAARGLSVAVPRAAGRKRPLLRRLRRRAPTCDRSLSSSRDW
jgi:hypothetical protein